MNTEKYIHPLIRCDRYTKLAYFLKTVPTLEVASLGIHKLSKRFKMKAEYLTILIDFARREGGVYEN